MYYGQTMIFFCSAFQPFHCPGVKWTHARVMAQSYSKLRTILGMFFAFFAQNYHFDVLEINYSFPKKPINNLLPSLASDLSSP